ncbi:MAG: glycosyltransferase [Methanosphaera sp.]|uniref:glycosyltransferase n=1 Tax=Methanosphaera sp. TaxID=2666342 RepID=UPI0025DD1D19|nr:glycosyltransferase [Methanosphaera sp.]MCI5867254.1 glycosyltransferase [Methanosphaera sp.]MDD6534678.1 glycosyltransferase [Methanosphaera sp.]MDY3955654.1 glycosyltransferase [Methanosphaera sp.]
MSQSEPKISVIMPSLNVGDYMDQCILSVINQTLDDIEIICIDAGSTDGTIEIINKYAKKDPRITLINTDVKSYGYQVNLGIKHAKGKYISIVETDDYIAKDMFKSLYDLSEDETVDIIKSNFYHRYDYKDGSYTLRCDAAKDNLRNTEKFILSDEPLFLEGHPSIWCGLYKRSFIEDNDIEFLEEPAGGWVDNPFFYESAIVAESIKYTPDAFYYYRESNPNSSSNTFKSFTLPMYRIMDIFDVIEKYNCHDANVMEMFYNRLFRYIEIILENNDNNPENLDMPTKQSIYDVLKRINPNDIKDVKTSFQKLYYKYSSPLFIK